MREQWETDDLCGSVIAVPPLARTAGFAFEPTANAALLNRLRNGGVTTYLYGGNANFYNVGACEYADLLDGLEAICPDDGWIIPSAGSDYGKLMEQAAVLRNRRFPLVMLLPGWFPAHAHGIERLVRDFAQAAGTAPLLYLKQDVLSPAIIGKLFAEGSISAVKYAIPRPDALRDLYLEELVKEVPRSRLVSGFGEVPAIAHMQGFALAGYTSGSVCLAPRQSTQMLAAAKAGDWAAAEQIKTEFAPFEAQRDAIDPIGVLHYALGWSGLEDMGPILPTAGEPAEHLRPAIAKAAQALTAGERVEGESVILRTC